MASASDGTSDEGTIEAARLARAIEAIKAVNATDPVLVELDGEQRAGALVHAERMSHWLHVLDPSATDVQHLAARAAHLRRWELPRSAYPDGRSGYLRWRGEAKRRQATEMRSVMTEVGYDEATAARAAEIVAKEGRRTDPQVQVHEDALCVVFLELQLDDLAGRLGDDHTVRVLRRTMAKMSANGLAATAGVQLSRSGRSLLARAMEPTATS